MSVKRETAGAGGKQRPPAAKVPAPMGPRVVEPETRVLMALAERYPRWTAAITGSERLRTAIRTVRVTTGATPEQIVSLLSARELDTAERPVGVLVSRCSRIIQVVQARARADASGRTKAAESAAERQARVASPTKSPPAARSAQAPPARSAQTGGGRSGSAPEQVAAGDSARGETKISVAYTTTSTGNMTPTATAVEMPTLMVVETPTATTVPAPAPTHPRTRREARAAQARDRPAESGTGQHSNREARSGDNGKISPPRTGPASVQIPGPVPAPASGHVGGEVRESQAPSGSSAFTPSSPIRARKATPGGGWQKAVYRASVGLVNPGPSRAEREHRQRLQRVGRPVQGRRHIAVVSMSGGVGKTTVASMVGHTFARHRGDRVVAVDASPHLGSLVHRISGGDGHSVRDLLEQEEAIRFYSDVRNYTAQASSRLEAVAADSDPAASAPLEGREYERAIDLLSRFYTVLITDCGPGMLDPSASSVLSLTDQLVIVISPTIDGARAGSRLLDWLDSHGYGALVADGVVVVNAVHSRSPVDIDECVDYFSTRVREVQLTPWDDFLAVGASTSLQSVTEETQVAYLDLAACIADGFGLGR